MVNAVDIYTISNPITNIVFYVGQTRSINTRIACHLSTKDTPVGKHIQELKINGINPVFTIVEKCEYAKSSLVETRWIDKLRKEYGFLFNYEVGSKLRNKSTLIDNSK